MKIPRSARIQTHPRTHPARAPSLAPARARRRIARITRTEFGVFTPPSGTTAVSVAGVDMVVPRASFPQRLSGGRARARTRASRAWYTGRAFALSRDSSHGTPTPGPRVDATA